MKIRRCSFQLLLPVRTVCYGCAPSSKIPSRGWAPMVCAAACSPHKGARMGHKQTNKRGIIAELVKRLIYSKSFTKNVVNS